jgi:hypothetical protein
MYPTVSLHDDALKLRDSGRTAISCGAREQPRAVMKQAGFGSMVSGDNVCPDINAALARTRLVASTAARQSRHQRQPAP